MQFEISIEGPSHALRAVRNELGHPFPPIHPLSRDGDDSKARMVLLIDGPDRLDEHMLVLTAAMETVERRLSMDRTLDIRVRNLAYSEPPGASPQFSEPFQPIPKLTIQPILRSLPRPSDAHTILLDPGNAFGTGKHPSTVLCLQAIHRMAEATSGSFSLPSADVLDFGCGTGLLAIAAVKMGAQRALGVEIDPASAETARDNVRRNGLADRIEIRQGSWEVVRNRYHMIVANLVPAALLKSIPHLPLHLREAGVAVLCGFGNQQAEIVKAGCESSGFSICEKLTERDWSAFVARRAR